MEQENEQGLTQYEEMKELERKLRANPLVAGVSVMTWKDIEELKVMSKKTENDWEHG